MEKVILHCDLNNFYASVECLKNNKLRNYPVAVGGNEEERHGIVLAKNEIAKSFGVKTAETIWQAKKKCPGLIVVLPSFELYKEYSRKVRKIYEKYTDYVEAFGLDECYLDVSDNAKIFGGGEKIANKIREEVKEKLGLTISVGVSFTKDFSKLGSDMKKPDAVTVITKENFKEKVWVLPANSLLGIGKVSSKKLETLGMLTIGEVANADVEILLKILGKSGYSIWESANGRSSDVVEHKDKKYIPKSVGHGITLSRDEMDYENLWKVIFELSQDIERRLRKYDLYTKCVKLTIKNSDFITKDMQTTLSYITRDSYAISKEAMELLKKQYIMTKPVRMVTVTAMTMEKEAQAVQMSLFDNIMEEKSDKIGELMEKINAKFGNDTVNYASLIKDK